MTTRPGRTLALVALLLLLAPTLASACPSPDLAGMASAVGRGFAAGTRRAFVDFAQGLVALGFLLAWLKSQGACLTPPTPRA